MRYLLTLALVLAVISSTSSVPASAQKNIQVKAVTETPTTLKLGPGAILEDCTVGNLNPAAYAVGGFMLPPEEYKLVFDPLASCAGCQIGFEVTNIHVVLQTADSCQIEMAVNIEEAVYPSDPECPEPGIEWANSGLVSMSIPHAGLWDIVIPVNCPCLTMDRLYLIGFYVNSATCEGGGVPDIILDAYTPQYCTNWNDYGAGWYDLPERYTLWTGNLMFFADANCCSPPVPAEHKTWGAIKELYTN